MNEDGTPIVAADNQPEAPVSNNPNELGFEMTAEQEQEYVNQILANGDYQAPEPEAPVVPEVPVAPVVETPPAPEAPVVPETPTETTAPQSDDLWVEVDRVVTDDLGEETVETVKLVYDPNDPSSFIPDDFTAKSTKQLAEIMEAKAEMAKLYGDRQAEFDKVESDKTAASQHKSILDGWNAEIKDLIDSGILEAPKLKEGEEGYNADPSVMKTEEVYKFMAEKNLERAKDGIAPIASFGLAYTMFENDATRKAEAEAEKKDNEETKLKGAMIGGGSAASGGTADQAAYVSGSHKSIWDVPVAD